VGIEKTIRNQGEWASWLLPYRHLGSLFIALRLPLVLIPNYT